MGLFDKVLGSIRTPDYAKELVNACVSGKIENVDKILKNNENVVNSQDKDGFTALIYAVSRGKSDVAELLIKSGADPNIQANDGNTALNFAVFNRHKDIVKLLLNNGSNPYIQNINSSTALESAALNGYKDIVELLIEIGVDPNIQADSGATVLFSAAGSGHKDTVKLLIENDADPNIQSDNGVTALMMAAGGGYKDTVKLLLESGANPNIQALNGNTALKIAASEGHQDIVKLLTETSRNDENKIREVLQEITPSPCVLEGSGYERAETVGIIKVCDGDELVSENVRSGESLGFLVKENYKRLSKNTINKISGISVKVDKEKVKGAVGDAVSELLADEDLIDNLRKEKIIGKKTAFALKLVKPHVEKKFKKQ